MIEALLAFLDIEALVEDRGIRMKDGRWKMEDGCMNSKKLKEEDEDWENTNPKWFITQQLSVNLNGCTPDMPHQPYLTFFHPN